MENLQAAIAVENVKEDMMDPGDPEDYAVHHDHSYMCMEKPCMCKFA